jgi:HCOMODA/2-hydroxy-3-carboxy-muconic semialdehyde decarboxylase
MEVKINNMIKINTKRNLVLFVTMAILVIVSMITLGAEENQSSTPVSAKAVDLDHMDTDETRKAEVALAAHILADQGVFDSFGHISVRSASDPNVFFIPRAMTPALVQVEDMVAVSVETGQPIDPDSPRCNGERFIHSELYKARPEINSVIHCHTADVIPFTVAGVPMRPVIAQADFLPLEVPVFEIRDVWGDAEERGVQIKNNEHAAAAAKAMGSSPVLLLRGHGMNVAADSVHRVVVHALYTMINAKILSEAIQLNGGGEIRALDQKELDYYPKENFDVERPWSNFLRVLRNHEAAIK